MKFGILSLVAAGALAVSSSSAIAGPPGHYYGGHGHGYNRGGHLDYHNGHYHYHNGNFRSGPLYPAYPVYSYPRYNYPSYSSGFGITIGGSRGVISIGSSSLYPTYRGGFYSQPYYGGFGRRW